MRALPQRRSTPRVVTMFLLASLALLTAVPVFADAPNPSSSLAAGGALMFVILIAVYVYFALAFQVIAQKTNTDNAWWAWIPILQQILMLNIAKKPTWWIILLFIPFVNIIIGIIVFMAIAEVRNKPSWWGILMIVPIVNLFVPGYLAWSD